MSSHPPTNVVGALGNARFAGALGLYLGTGQADLQVLAKALYDKTTTPGYNARGYGVWASVSVAQAMEGALGRLDDAFPNLNTAWRGTVRNAWTYQATKELVEPAADSGFRFGFANEMWSTFHGIFTTPNSAGAVALAMQPNAAISAALHQRAAYHLGGNELDLCHMTGIGQQRERSVFLPDLWSLLDDDGPVHRTDMPPGHSVYMRADLEVVGDGSEYSFSQSTLHPPSNAWFYASDGAWPYAERRIPNRMSIAGSEFTVHQNSVANALAYGLLTGPAPTLAEAVATPPVVALNLAAGAAIERAREFPLVVHAGPEVRRVAYYLDWHWLGESTDTSSHFRLAWRPETMAAATAGSHLVTAVAWDRHGERSLRTTAVEALTTLVEGAYVAPTGLAITGLPAGSLTAGRAYALTAALTPARSGYLPVFWSSDAPAVASIDADGTLHALSSGTATITVTTADASLSASAVIEVVFVPLIGLDILGAPAYLSVNHAVPLTAALTPSETSQDYVVWSSSDPAVATVDADGLVQGLAEGSVTITVSGGAGISDSVVIPVQVVAVQGVAIAGAPATMVPGQTATLTAQSTPADASNPQLVWQSSAPEVATIGADGLLSAVAYGSTRITLIALANGATDSAVVRVVPTVDPFAYAAVPLEGLDGGSGWGGAWSGCGASVVLADDSLAPSGTVAGLARSGGRLRTDNSTGDFTAQRLLGRTRSGGHTWLAALVHYDGTTNWAGSYLSLAMGAQGKLGIGLKNESPVEFQGVVHAGTWNTGWIDGQVLRSGRKPAGAAFDEQRAFLVVHVDHAAATVCFYLDPVPGADPGSLIPFATFSSSTDSDLDPADLAFDRITLSRQNTAARIITWDEIRIADTWAAVAPRILVPRRISIGSGPGGPDWWLLAPADGPDGVRIGDQSVFDGLDAAAPVHLAPLPAGAG